MASSGQDFLLDDMEYQVFIKDAKIALQTLVKDEIDGHLGAHVVSAQDDSDEATDMASKVFDYIILRVTRDGTPDDETIDAIGRAMHMYSTDQAKRNNMKFLLYQFVYDWTEYGDLVRDSCSREHYSHINRSLKWNNERRIYTYISRLAEAMVKVALVQRYFKESADDLDIEKAEA